MGEFREWRRAWPRKVHRLSSECAKHAFELGCVVEYTERRTSGCNGRAAKQDVGHGEFWVAMMH